MEHWRHSESAVFHTALLVDEPVGADRCIAAGYAPCGLDQKALYLGQYCSEVPVGAFG